ncbi:hypothetical protein NMB32_04895 [Stenotrophomonas sp. CD2]|nr:hypothetical protein NMB32_04895 [Stenotrophomonas sp. CD2]
MLLTVLLAGCAGNAQTPANEDPAAAKAGTDDGHGHAADSKEAKAETAKAPADADEGVVQLTPEQIKASGIEVVAIGRGGGGSTRLSGRVEPSVGARASVASTVTGRVERVLVAPGTAVKQNQALAIVVSGEAAVFRANALAASAEAEAARLAYGRDKALVDQGVVARQELEASRARSLAAQARPLPRRPRPPPTVRPMPAAACASPARWPASSATCRSPRAAWSLPAARWPMSPIRR